MAMAQVTKSNGAPVPMKFFGAWEIDKTPANCIPRLCTVTINRLVLLKPYATEANSLMVAVKMQQSSKRTLRSNEISIPSSTTGDQVVELDLTFALQYSHFLKEFQKGGNQLQIQLQRKKRYKNRAILGYKTLAVGVINMAEVLQRSNYMEKQLELRDNSKDLRKSDIVARIYMSTLKSQPVDHEGLANGRLKSLNQSAEADSGSDIDDFSQSEGSDSEPLDENGGESGGVLRKYRKRRTKPSLGNESLENPSAHQRNLKQKFIALLKKFRIPDSEASDSEEHYREALEKEFIAAGIEAAVDDQIDEDDIFDFDDSDSTQEFDGFSISSTPRPGLKPFFSSKTTLVESDDRDKQQALRRLHSEATDKNIDSLDKDFITASSSPKPSLRPFFSSKGLTGHGHDADINESGRCETEEHSSGTEQQTPDTSDTSLKHTFSLDETGKQKLDKEKKVKPGSAAKTAVKDTLLRLGLRK